MNKDTVQTIVAKPNISKTTGKIYTDEEVGVSLDKQSGRPLNAIYQEMMPEYKKFAIEHFKNGGSLSTLNGYIFDVMYERFKKDTIKAADCTPSPEWFERRVDPESPYFDKEFCGLVMRFKKLKDYFWTHKAILAKVDPKKYQLYMANNYGWTLKNDLTSNGEKIEMPIIHRPVAEQIVNAPIDGEISE